ncbi:MerR family transcriptional regulator [Croceicoccus marinus]
MNLQDLRADIASPGSTDTQAGTDAAGDNALLGIQDVARKLGVTLRALRFYEKEGLIKPERVGTTRVYTRREIAGNVPLSVETRLSGGAFCEVMRRS